MTNMAMYTSGRCQKDDHSSFVSAPSAISSDALHEQTLVTLGSRSPNENDGSNLNQPQSICSVLDSHSRYDTAWRWQPLKYHLLSARP